MSSAPHVLVLQDVLSPSCRVWSEGSPPPAGCHIRGTRAKRRLKAPLRGTKRRRGSSWCEAQVLLVHPRRILQTQRGDRVRSGNDISRRGKTFKRDRMRKRRLEETQVSYRQGVTYWDVMCMSPFLMEDACECSIWKGENELFPLQRLMHVL